MVEMKDHGDESVHLNLLAVEQGGLVAPLADEVEPNPNLYFELAAMRQHLLEP